MCRVILRSRADPSHPPDPSPRPHSRDPASRASLNPRLATGCSEPRHVWVDSGSCTKCSGSYWIRFRDGKDDLESEASSSF